MPTRNLPSIVALTTTTLLGLAAKAEAQRQFEALPRAAVSLPQTLIPYRKSVGDLDGDGDLDVVALMGWYRNDGRGVLSAAGSLTCCSGPHGNGEDYQTFANAVGDIDGDGDLDVVFGWGSLNGAGLTWAINDGTGQFTQMGNYQAGGYHTSDLALGDVDGDGDLDLVVANHWYPAAACRLLLNDGSGNWSAPTTLASISAAAVELGDIDGDGDLDIAVAAAGYSTLTQNRLLRNDGGGVFTDVTASNMPLDSDFSFDLAFGDVDGDGDLDMVIANSPYGAGFGQNRIYRNDGFGVFSDATAMLLPIALDTTRSVALGDLDGDGDLDIVFGNDGQDRMLRNDGSGLFTDVTAQSLPAENQPSSGVVLGDLDGDGDLDILGAEQWTNLQWQLYAPVPMQVGQTWALDVYRRSGPPIWFCLALPFAALAPASIPLGPLGTFGLDPASVVRLPGVVVPQGSGVGSLSFLIPNQPLLIGLPVYAQTMLVSFPPELRLSNVVAEVIQ